jgi:hypothetical protein
VNDEQDEAGRGLDRHLHSLVAASTEGIDCRLPPFHRGDTAALHRSTMLKYVPIRVGESIQIQSRDASIC